MPARVQIRKLIHMIVLAFVCLGLRLHDLESVEIITNLNSSWLYCLLLLTVALLCLLWLALVVLAACAFRSTATQV